MLAYRLWCAQAQAQALVTQEQEQVQVEVARHLASVVVLVPMVVGLA